MILIREGHRLLYFYYKWDEGGVTAYNSHVLTAYKMYDKN